MGILAITICPEEHAEIMDIIMDAMGQGTGQFPEGRMVCALDPAATSGTPPTHRLINNTVTPPEVKNMLEQMAIGAAMPTVEWFGTGYTYEQGVAAAGTIKVISFASSDAMTSQQNEAYIVDWLASMGLQFVSAGGI
jgi:hypothetical protein